MRFAFVNLVITAASMFAVAGCISSPIESRPQIPEPPHIVSHAVSFAYPVSKSETVTQKKDKDGWYNALDLGQNDHLGEDWNMNTGGNADCGEPVYAAANGFITLSGHAGPGWGNVLTIEHTLPSGEKVESFYGHMQDTLRADGEVKKREQIGKVGNANGRYPCHLHFELRTSDCPMWNQPGGGYDRNRKGWLDPSDFMDSHR